MEQVQRGQYDTPSNPTGLVREEKKTAKAVGSGSVIAGACGLGAAVLAILGVIGLAPYSLCAIAVIAAGAGLAFQGGGIMARYQELLAEADEGRTGAAEIETGMSVEAIGGIAGIVLGILALFNVAPHALLAVSAITLGGTLILASGSTARLNDLRDSSRYANNQHPITRHSVSGAAGGDILIGLGAVVLGILSLIGVDHSAVNTAYLGNQGYSPELVLVAMIAVGVGVLLNGSALGTRMAAIFRH